MQLQVQKDVEPPPAQLSDEISTGGVEELHAYLEPVAAAVQPIDEIEGFARGGQVESDNELILRAGCFRERMLVELLLLRAGERLWLCARAI